MRSSRWDEEIKSSAVYGHMLTLVGLFLYQPLEGKLGKCVLQTTNVIGGKTSAKKGSERMVAVLKTKNYLWHQCSGTSPGTQYHMLPWELCFSVPVIAPATVITSILIPWALGSAALAHLSVVPSSPPRAPFTPVSMSWCVCVCAHGRMAWRFCRRQSAAPILRALFSLT